MVCVCLCFIFNFSFFFAIGMSDLIHRVLSVWEKHAVSVSDHSLAAGVRVGVPGPPLPLFNLADSLLTPVVFFFGFFLNLCVFISRPSINNDTIISPLLPLSVTLCVFARGTAVGHRNGYQLSPSVSNCVRRHSPRLFLYLFALMVA